MSEAWDRNKPCPHATPDSRHYYCGLVNCCWIGCDDCWPQHMIEHTWDKHIYYRARPWGTQPYFKDEEASKRVWARAAEAHELFHGTGLEKETRTTCDRRRNSRRSTHENPSRPGAPHEHTDSGTGTPCTETQEAKGSKASQGA